MTLGAESHCVKHREVKAVGRCRQCGSPFCGECRVDADRQSYCSMECRANHKRYAHRAEELDNRIRGAGLLRLAKTLLFVAVVAAALAVGLHFFGIEVPVVSSMLGRPG